MNSKEAIKNIKRTMIINRNGNIDVGNKYNKEIIIIEKDLEILEEFEILKNYYEPFKQFLKDMFEKGYNKDLTKVKEWLENDK